MQREEHVGGGGGGQDSITGLLLKTESAHSGGYRMLLQSLARELPQATEGQAYGEPNFLLHQGWGREGRRIPLLTTSWWGGKSKVYSSLSSLL